MKTTSRPNLWRKQGAKARGLIARACLIGSLPLTAQETPKSADDKKPAVEKTAEKTDQATTEYNNWITLGAGSTFIDGDKSQFMQHHEMRKGPIRGVEDFHWAQ